MTDSGRPLASFAMGEPGAVPPVLIPASWGRRLLAAHAGSGEGIALPGQLPIARPAARRLPRGAKSVAVTAAARCPAGA